MFGSLWIMRAVCAEWCVYLYLNVCTTVFVSRLHYFSLTAFIRFEKIVCEEEITGTRVKVTPAYVFSLVINWCAASLCSKISLRILCHHEFDGLVFTFQLYRKKIWLFLYFRFHYSLVIDCFSTVCQFFKEAFSLRLTKIHRQRGFVSLPGDLFLLSCALSYTIFDNPHFIQNGPNAKWYYDADDECSHTILVSRLRLSIPK